MVEAKRHFADSATSCLAILFATYFDVHGDAALDHPPAMSASAGGVQLPHSLRRGAKMKAFGVLVRASGWVL